MAMQGYVLFYGFIPSKKNTLGRMPGGEVPRIKCLSVYFSAAVM